MAVVADQVSIGDLRLAAERLSARYREGKCAHAGGFGSDAERVAYVITRMPATLAATKLVLAELRARCPSLGVETLLDIGSGPATSLWAVRAVLGQLSAATLVESDIGMEQLAAHLLAAGAPDDHLTVRWTRGWANVVPHDLVIVGYLLNELPAAVRVDAVETAWAAAKEALVVIEPGSTAGFRAILDVRQRLIERGATIVAPCPHTQMCPLPSGDWCHFGARLNRSSLHRRLKAGSQPFEDEKFSYVIATRGSGSAASARLIRRPAFRERQVVLRLCRDDGVQDSIVPRSHRAAYRRARKAKWGGTWDDESG